MAGQMIVTAERVFDKHAASLGLPPLGEQTLNSYIKSNAFSKIAERYVREAYEAASVADNAAVASWLTQTRHVHDNPVPPATGR